MIKNRDHQLDNIRGILLFLVVFGHALELLRFESVIAEFVYDFIYTFHMPVFIFISGYVSKNVEKGRSTAFRQFFIPFLIFNSIWNVIQLITTSIVAIPVDSPTVFSFLNPGWALWFILALFIWKTFLPDLIKIKNIMAVILVIGVFSRLFSEFNVFMSLSRMLVYSPYFIGGYLLSKENYLQLTKINILIPIAVIIITLIFTFHFVFDTNLTTEFLWADRPYAHFTPEAFISICYGIILYIIGFGFTTVFIRFSSHKESRITKLGRNSMSVYILHTYVVGAVSFIILSANDYIEILILALLSLGLCYVLSTSTVNKWFQQFLSLFDQIIFKKD